MTDDLDDMLARLARSSTHPGLDALDRAVFARIDAARVARRAGGMLALASAAAALLMGVAGATLPAAAAQAAPSLSPFGPADPLAPSTLLGGDH
ncbi:hypothetical protein [Sphingomonas oryzagri]